MTTKEKRKEWKQRYYAAHPEKKKEMYKRHWEREKLLMETDPEFRAKRIACRRASGLRYYYKNKERINKYIVEYERNSERAQLRIRKYRKENREYFKQKQREYREAHKEYYRQKQRGYYARKKARKAQIQALQATIAELVGKLSTLEHARVQNERQRLQWGWDIQQVRIKLHRTRGEYDRMCAKTRRRS